MERLTKEEINPQHHYEYFDSNFKIGDKAKVISDLDLKNSKKGDVGIVDFIKNIHGTNFITLKINEQKCVIPEYKLEKINK